MTATYLVLCPEGISTKGGSNGHSNHVDHMVNVSSSSFSSLTFTYHHLEQLICYGLISRSVFIASGKIRATFPQWLKIASGQAKRGHVPTSECLPVGMRAQVP